MSHVLVPEDCRGASGETAALATELEDIGAFAQAHVAPVADVETVAVTCADGRVLAEDVHAATPLPPFDHSAVDGYGLPASRLEARGAVIPITGRVRAGASPPPLRGGALRVLTGAPVPPSVAAVVMQEHVRRTKAGIVLGDTARKGSNIRRRGEDAPVGDRVASAGARLDGRHVALMSALGITRVVVRRRLRAAILAFGDELAAPGAPRAKAQIYDSNTPLTAALLARRGVDVVHCARVGDRREAVENAFRRLVGSVDLIVTSGGMADGDEDHTRAAVASLGGEWRPMAIRMKPGKPSAFALLDGGVVLGLPGNPFAALVALLVIGTPVLAALGAAPGTLRPIAAAAAFDGDRRPGRFELFPARRVEAPGEPLRIDRLSKGGSARLRPLVDADGLGLIAADVATIRKGERLRFLPFDGLL